MNESQKHHFRLLVNFDARPIQLLTSDSLVEKLAKFEQLLWRSRAFVSFCDEHVKCKIVDVRQFTEFLKSCSFHCDLLYQAINTFYCNPELHELFLRAREQRRPPNYLGGDYETNASAHLTMLSNCGLTLGRMVELLDASSDGQSEWPEIEWTEGVLYDLDCNSRDEFVLIRANLRPHIQQIDHRDTDDTGRRINPGNRPGEGNPTGRPPTNAKADEEINTAWLEYSDNLTEKGRVVARDVANFIWQEHDANEKYPAAFQFLWAGKSDEKPLQDELLAAAKKINRARRRLKSRQQGTS